MPPVAAPICASAIRCILGTCFIVRPLRSSSSSMALARVCTVSEASPSSQRRVPSFRADSCKTHPAGSPIERGRFCGRRAGSVFRRVRYASTTADGALTPKSRPIHRSLVVKPFGALDLLAPSQGTLRAGFGKLSARRTMQASQTSHPRLRRGFWPGRCWPMPSAWRRSLSRRRETSCRGPCCAPPPWCG